ncbi:16S rRNA (guanine(527)-N(7))-methyltransferase RsmG [Mycoplasmopsis felis]|uniref:16S rRNA (guanine(527)-N(7))-methyltransferase RsmG n=1 Tax=Mycoplasmopsis felis TaxID=33923 RepID=UPI002AFF395A|nr:16S rRNA (guanine(527)-N(7))-methyltransferase RsmG [Mycoplasmopsis felis]WQQ08879.1 16S rRNA (guanine(527)-N(7))-methyltransferase RsmG [Mycoplasmopsis felis]
MNKNQKVVYELCLKNNWNYEKLEKYVELIEEKNKVMNLTGFSGDKLWGDGILESLNFMKTIMNDQNHIKFLDIGSGVGFPSLPYFIANPNFELDIFEPLQKRVNFLNLVKETLNLKNINIYKKRMEEEKNKNIYDIVSARAVADVQTMLLASFHLVKLNGTMILLKSKNIKKEIREASFPLNKLKAEIWIKELFSPNIDRDNKILFIKKLRSTPANFPYPWKEIIKIKKHQKLD